MDSIHAWFITPTAVARLRSERRQAHVADVKRGCNDGRDWVEDHASYADLHSYTRALADTEEAFLPEGEEVPEDVIAADAYVAAFAGCVLTIHERLEGQFGV